MEALRFVFLRVSRVEIHPYLRLGGQGVRNPHMLDYSGIKVARITWFGKPAPGRDALMK